MNMFSTTNDQLTTKTIISAAASAAATAMVIRSVTKEYIPHEVQSYIYSKLYSLFHYFSSELTLVIDEYDNLNKNSLFSVVEIYLESKIPPNTNRIKLSIPKKEDKVTIYLDKNQEIVDMFNGVKLNWKFVSKQVQVKYIHDNYGSTPISEYKCFQLSFNKKHKDMVIESYIKHVIEESKQLKQKKKTLRLLTYGMGGRMSGRISGEVWQSVNLDHPATFETLAMDTEVKKVIMEDLKRFVKRKEFYRRVGKAWKRGYLLYGPPGTGKSSLIAAMANFLKFDIYDLELTAIRSNTDLRSLLISTGNKSILVVEDIDCSIELQDRRAKAKRTMNPLFDDGYRTEQSQVTLSGLLNFIDGLWSSCGDERIIVFTTNHREKPDPALLRPGRMDVHIHMSYCTPCGFRMLASNYLGDTTEHEALLLEVEELLEITKVTPAEVGEQLMKSEEPEVALRGLIDFLEGKRTESVEKNSDEGKDPVKDSGSEVTEDAKLVEGGDENKPE